VNRERAQSTVVGVALLLAITTVSLSLLTASAGTVVERQVATAAEDRATDAMRRALDPEGPSGRVAVGDGRFRTRTRSVRLTNDDGVVAEREVTALVYERGGRRVTYLAGGVVQGSGDAASLAVDPTIRTGEGVLLLSLSVPEVRRVPSRPNATGATTIERTDATHARSRFAGDEWGVAVETAAPGAWNDYFRAQNATTTRRDFDGDDVPSVVATFSGRREAYLVVHRVDLEVRDG
jgi:hypothetical protein